MKAGRLTDAQARHEAIILFKAGHGDASTGPSWVWYLVCRHAEVEAKCVQEVDEARL